jgi:thiosulfate dehydrogenase [quinone] large subunit
MSRLRTLSAGLLTRSCSLSEFRPHLRTTDLWLVVRIYVGWDFLDAGWHKFNTAAWMDGSGRGIVGFWQGALAVNNGEPVITYDWYRSFIQFLVDAHAEGWFSYFIVFGELAVWLGLAWKNAGYLGFDRLLLPLLGTPWKQQAPRHVAARPVVRAPAPSGILGA